MHEYVLHFYNPTDQALVLINYVSRNKQIFSKKTINGAEQAQTLDAKLGYPSVKNFIWIVKRQQIVDYTVTVQYIYIVHAIWGEYIVSLKGNTTLGRN